jgi:tRNA G18 (ribose-2'-O)-methylase SpoU
VIGEAKPSVIRVESAIDPRLDDYRELRDPRARRRIEGDEFFICEGPVALERLLASDHRLRSVMVLERRLPATLELLSGNDVPVFVVDAATMREVSGFDLHRGVIAAAERQPARTLEEVIDGARRIVVLEGLNDPENLGAIARSARAFGAEAMIVDATCIDPYTRRSVRVSMGEILHLPWVRVESVVDTCGRLRELGVVTWALTPARDADPLSAIDAPGRLALLLGAEGPGLSASALSAVDRRVRIPIASDVDSLNVAAAAAVALSHLPT